MELKDLKNKKILILGFGREGRDTFLFLRKLFPKKTIGIADRNPKLSLGRLKPGLVRKHFGKNYLKALKNYEVVVKSPGIPFKILPKSALKKITTQTEIFFDNCKGTIVGVTGTKGKSTTSAMIYSVLKAGKVKAHLIGNIGKPVLSFLSKAVENEDQQVYVYELSSHQLYNLKKSPQIAVFLNVFPEHLDYYRSFKEYVKAKTNIVLYQKKEDYLIYNTQDKIIREIVKKSKTELPSTEAKVKMRTKFSSPARKIPIKGKYYNLNREAAKAVGEIFGVSSRIISKTLKNFKYLPHRLEPAGTYKGITFYNDALATIPEATIQALETLGNKVETIMLGGFERNIDYKNLAKEVLKRKIKTVILFPTTGRRIWRDIVKVSKGRGVPKHFFTDNMKEAVKLAYLHTKRGKICLLSTASPSFSIFKDYEEKGNLFKKYVKQLAYGKTS